MQASDELMVLRKLVVVFDLCSSTAVLEDLLRTDSAERWRALLSGLRRYLWAEQGRHGFQVYKFIGDGWILLFEPRPGSGDALLAFLAELSAEYDALYADHIATVLGSPPAQVGISFGIDEGRLGSLLMDGQREYFGRPLNLAARLQAAVKQLDGVAAGTVLLSKNAAAQLRPGGEGVPIECRLANVSGGERYQALRYNVLVRELPPLLGAPVVVPPLP